MILTNLNIQEFSEFLCREEKSTATQEKYLRDAAVFRTYAEGAKITKELVISWKKHLIEQGYAVRSINSMLDSLPAINCMSSTSNMSASRYFFLKATVVECRIA